MMIKKRLKNIKLPRRNKTENTPQERITNETVAQHREKILAGGRKFKYPVQYARHKLVINTIAISILALAVFGGLVWWQLYQAQNTGAFFYRITQLVPLPVAKVEDQNALYSNYLMEYRSSIHWLQTKSRNFNINSPDGKRQANHIKRQSLDSAVEAAYAEKIAREENISVSEGEIDQFIKQTLEGGERKLSQESYQAVLSDSYGVSESEYRSIVRLALLKQKVSLTIDKQAKKKIQAALRELQTGKTFEVVAQQYSEEQAIQATNGDVGFVPKDNQDRGVTKQALKLKKGQMSGIIEVAGAYYIFKLTEINDSQVRYSRIKVEPRQFDKQLTILKKQDKIQEYITVTE